MSLKYKLIWRKDLRKDAPADARLVYGATKATRRYAFAEMCQDIVDNCSATEGDVKMVVSALVSHAKKALLRGEIVVIEGLGNLQLRSGSIGVASEEEFRTHMMKKPNVLFRPSTSLLELKDKAKFEAYEVVERSVECDKTHSLD
ncbi:MAG: HU family DNA-binding protein [Tannerellaceae bacterium]